MKTTKFTIHLIALLSTTLCLAQSTSIKKFSLEDQKFEGTKLEQAKFLLRYVKPMGIISKKEAKIPEFLEGVLKDSITVPSVFAMNMYLIDEDIDVVAIGGDVSAYLSENANGTMAKYFVIHDTSAPNYKKKEFPDNINEDSWKFNKVERKKDHKKKAHAFIGRTGKVFFQNNFETPWRSTKFETQILKKSISRGLFVHIELVQPRRSMEGKWADNDVLAPEPGFTAAQYDKLALLYVCASTRAREWLVPVFHSTLDHKIHHAHDDPQNFDLKAFNESLKALIEIVKS